MVCSNTNILLNGGFRRGSTPWTGKNFKRVSNPVYKGDYSILLTPGSVLKQTRSWQLEAECAYYLYFRILNISPANIQGTLFATVVYMDINRRILRSTPLLIELPRATALAFKPYFTIVPPPPKGTKLISVVFSGIKGSFFVDYIRLAAHTV